MRRKNQNIPDSIWKKLEFIKSFKEGWPMMTIVNECLDIGANWWIKKLTKKEPTTKSPEAGSSEIVDDEQLKRNIEIAKTEWVDK